jgi:hypothetical protein
MYHLTKFSKVGPSLRRRWGHLKFKKKKKKKKKNFFVYWSFKNQNDSHILDVDDGGCNQPHKLNNLNWFHPNKSMELSNKKFW